MPIKKVLGYWRIDIKFSWKLHLMVYVFTFCRFFFQLVRIIARKNGTYVWVVLLLNYYVLLLGNMYLHVLRNMSYLSTYVAFDWICSLRKNDILHFVIWVLWCEIKERKIEFECLFVRNSILCLKVFYLLVKKITTYSIWLLSNGNKSRGPNCGKYYPEYDNFFFRFEHISHMLCQHCIANLFCSFYKES